MPSAYVSRGRGVDWTVRVQADITPVIDRLRQLSKTAYGRDYTIPTSVIREALLVLKDWHFEIYNYSTHEDDPRLVFNDETDLVAPFAYLDRVDAMRSVLAFARHQAAPQSAAIDRQRDFLLPVLKEIGFYPTKSGYTDANIWTRDPGITAFQAYFANELPKYATSVITADAVVQQITEERAKEAFIAARSKYNTETPKVFGESHYPMNTGAWLVPVLAMEKTSWEFVDGVLTRKLPIWPLQSKLPIATTNVEGADVSLLSWAAFGTQGNALIVHLSAVGPVSKVMALWGHILDSKRGMVSLKTPSEASYYDQTTYARRMEGARIYERFIVRELPVSGYTHMVLQHRSALRPAMGKNFAHIVGNLSKTPDIDLFFEQINGALTVPFFREDAQKMWDFGVAAGLIQECLSYGCSAYWVIADERRWTEIRVAIGKGQSLAEATGSAAIETIGEAVKGPVDDFEIIAEHSDGDDELEDSDEE